MVRKVAVSGCVTLLALVAGCTGAASTASHATGSKVSAITAVSAASPCPATGTKKFSKTLYVTDAGLAAGAFRQWIYLPYQEGAFSKEALGRPESVARAGAAGGYILTRLRSVKAGAQSSPALCKLTIGVIDKLTSSVRGIVAGAKKGSITPAQVTSGVAYLSRLAAASAEAGVGFSPLPVASLPASD
jgi:hypothetical protein